MLSRKKLKTFDTKQSYEQFIKDPASFYEVLTFLPVADILTMQRVSRLEKHFASRNTFWQNLVARDFSVLTNKIKNDKALFPDETINYQQVYKKTFEELKEVKERVFGEETPDDVDPKNFPIPLKYFKGWQMVEVYGKMFVDLSNSSKTKWSWLYPDHSQEFVETVFLETAARFIFDKVFGKGLEEEKRSFINKRYGVEPHEVSRQVRNTTHSNLVKEYLDQVGLAIPDVTLIKKMVIAGIASLADYTTFTNDVDLVKILVVNGFPGVLRIASPTLRDDKEVVMEIIRMGDFLSYSFIRMDRLVRDVDIIKLVIQVGKHAGFRCIPEEVGVETLPDIVTYLIDAVGDDTILDKIDAVNQSDYMQNSIRPQSRFYRNKDFIAELVRQGKYEELQFVDENWFDEEFRQRLTKIDDNASIYFPIPYETSSEEEYSDDYDSDEIFERAWKKGYGQGKGVREKYKRQTRLSW
jgi:hypothetical protein